MIRPLNPLLNYKRLLPITLCLGMCTSFVSGGERVSVEGIAAIVDGEPISLSEIEEFRQVLVSQRPNFQTLPAAQQREEVLQRLIDEKVVLAKAKQDTTLRVLDKDVAGRVNDIYSRSVEQQGGEKALELALRQSIGMSLGQYKVRLEEQLRDQMYRQRVQSKFVGDPEASQLQVKDFFKKYKDSLPMQKDGMRLSHIQWRIKANAKIDLAAKTKALDLIKRLDKGESFATLAKESSDDPSGKEGGDLGFTKKGTLDPDFESNAFNLDVGEYSTKPVFTRFGYHIIRVTGKKDNEIRTSHILVRIIPSTDDTIRAKVFLDSLRATIKTAEAFASLARTLSEDRKTKDHGGDLGWFPRDQLNLAYKAAVDSLGEGNICEPILIGDSYHLFRVNRKALERRLTLEEDYDQIANFTKEWVINDKLTGLVKKWREHIHVENRLSTFHNLDNSISQAPEETEPSQDTN